MAGQQRSTATESFADRTVVLCRPDDSELGAQHGAGGGFEQSDDGPVRIVITAHTSDEKCERLGKRFGVEAARLRTFRDTPALRQVVVVDARRA